MPVAYTNNASSTLSATITDSTTSLSVAFGDGAKFPSISGGDHFYITVTSGANIEIMKVTARSTDTFAVVRGQDGTLAQPWASGAKVELRLVRALLDDMFSVPKALGNTTPNTGAFTTLSATGNVTLGDGSGDTLTINGTAVTAPNSLNFDAGTFFIDTVNDRVGIGTDAPYAALTVVSQGTGNVRAIVGEHYDNTTAFSQFKVIGSRARGSRGNPSAVLADDTLASFNGRGYKATGWSDTVGGFYVYAAENWTDSATGTFLALRGAAAGGTTVSEYARFTSTGVGIGTTSTAYKLEVYGSANGYVGQRIYNPNAGSSAVAYLQIGNDTNGATAQLGLNSAANTTNFGGGNGLYLANGLSAPIAFATSGSERMRIDSSGNVGIGTSSPSYRLSVKQSGNTSTASLGITSSNSANDTFIGFGYDATSDTNRIFSSYVSTGAYKPITFWTTDTERMRIDSSGNVGIGTSSPASKLHIVTAASATNALKITDGSTYTINAGSVSADVGYIGTDTGSALALYTNNTEKVRITTGGNVGIGTTSPAARLDLGTSTSNNVKLFTYKSADANQGFGYDPVAGDSYVMSFFSGGLSDAVGAFSFGRRRTDTGVYTERMRINASGTVAIKQPGASWDTSPALVIASGGDGYLMTRHIRGKTAGADNADRLYLNYANSNGVEIGGPMIATGNVTAGDWVYSNYGIQHTSGVGTNRTFGIFFDNGGSTAYAIFREAGSFDYPYPDLRIAFHTGIKIGANAGYGGVRFFTDYDMGTEVFSVNNGDANVRVRNTLYVSTANTTGGGIKLADDGDIVDLNDGFCAMRFSYGVRIYSANSGGSVRHTLDYNGNLTSTGNITAYSDARLKENIVDVDNALDKVSRMRGVYYNRADDETKSRRVGVVAQEVKDVLPELVLLNDDPDYPDGIYSVDYGKISALLIEAVKELRSEVQALKQVGLQ